MWPAIGKAIWPPGSTMTWRSNFGSCNTEMLRLSPDLIVWASAPVANPPKNSRANTIRITTPFCPIGYESMRGARRSSGPSLGQNGFATKHLAVLKPPLDRKDAELLLVCNNFLHNGLRNRFLTARESLHQCRVTQDFGHSRNASPPPGSV